MDGLKTVVDIYAEQNNLKGPIPNPEKYVDQSYLRQALKEWGIDEPKSEDFGQRRQGAKFE